MNNIKVLIGCVFYNNLTGSELYVYELASNLKKNGVDVSIVSAKIGNPLLDLTLSQGIKVYDFNTLPNQEKFDLIHSQHTPITQELTRRFPNVSKICTIHSELGGLETPFVHKSIKKYIVIRPSIKELLMYFYNVPEEKISIIYNPIDDNRFNTINTKDDGYILYVGTIDYLRKESIFDCSNLAKVQNREFWLVGKNGDSYLNDLIKEPHVKYFSDTIQIENIVKNCHQTAGILMGRTTIEGWMCGKPGWIYNIDSTGKVLDKKLHLPPTDLEKFYTSNVINQIITEYKKIV